MEEPASDSDSEVSYLSLALSLSSLCECELTVSIHYSIIGTVKGMVGGVTVISYSYYPDNAIIMCFKELLIGTEGAMYRVVGVGR